MEKALTYMQTTTSFKHPANWRSSELLNRDDFKITLTDLEVSEIRQALENSDIKHDGEAISHSPSDFGLSDLSKKLSRIQDSLENGSGVTVLKGLPISEFSEQQLKVIFAGMMSYVGTAVSQSADGDRIFSVRDEGFGASDSRTRGPNTKNRLSFHTDRCDVITFLCVKQAKSGGDNFVVSSIALYNEILKRRPDLMEQLTQPYFYKRHNVDSGNDLAYIKQPIFSIHEGHFAANYLRVLIERAYNSPDIAEMTALQREALDYVDELAEDPSLHVRFRQEPGDIVLLNNFVTFHRRDEFEDFDEVENRRHLLRIWLSVPNSRPLHPLFAGNYGSTTAGSIRGGMKKRA